MYHLPLTASELSLSFEQVTDDPSLTYKIN